MAGIRAFGLWAFLVAAVVSTVFPGVASAASGAPPTVAYDVFNKPVLFPRFSGDYDRLAAFPPLVARFAKSFTVGNKMRALDYIGHKREMALVEKQGNLQPLNGFVGVFTTADPVESAMTAEQCDTMVRGMFGALYEDAKKLPFQPDRDVMEGSGEKTLALMQEMAETKKFGRIPLGYQRILPNLGLFMATLVTPSNISKEGPPEFWVMAGGLTLIKNLDFTVYWIERYKNAGSARHAYSAVKNLAAVTLKLNGELPQTGKPAK